MWIVSEFESASLFSLKASNATTSGGKSLLLPTPYAIKMALLDVCFRLVDAERVKKRWPTIAGLEVAIRPAAHVIVSNTFQRILRPFKNLPKPDSPEFEGPFQRTIGYREYVQWVGPIGIALSAFDRADSEWLTRALTQITYFGKRGSLVQLIATPAATPDLPKGFVNVTRVSDAYSINGHLQLLDDASPNASFERLNVFDKNTKLKQSDRVLRGVVLPYRIRRASKSYTWYERID